MVRRLYCVRDYVSKGRRGMIDYLGFHGKDRINQWIETQRVAASAIYDRAVASESVEREALKKLSQAQTALGIANEALASSRAEHLKTQERFRESQRVTNWALLSELVTVLQQHCGEAGQSEGAVETLQRIVRECADLRDESEGFRRFMIRYGSRLDAVGKMLGDCGRAGPGMFRRLYQALIAEHNFKKVENAVEEWA